jgi:hypothetical protein
MPELSPSIEKPKRRRRKPRVPGEPTARDAETQSSRRSEIEDRLDAGLEETFPASDPVAVDSRSD